jgi:predicted ester cyclase
MPPLEPIPDHLARSYEEYQRLSKELDQELEG